MQVFVLLARYDYEGDTLLGVYDTADAASAAYEDLARRSNGVRFGDEVVIEEVTIGAPAMTRW